ncbi:hypothetical protein KCP75_15315 [Salmonella enterica subsp. enterica]|nr:hypothetical protein KCP75_15315 [Salmonella enterica subsp. enterica]
MNGSSFYRCEELQGARFVFVLSQGTARRQRDLDVQTACFCANAERKQTLCLTCAPIRRFTKTVQSRFADGG